jgi:hypothetical protein
MTSSTGIFSSSTYAIANYLTFTIPDIAVQYRFQNFYISQTVPWVNGDHTFLPFGFSGITVDRNGSNVEAVLTFPNTSLTRAWGREAIENFWLARVRVVRVDPDDPQVAADNPDTYRLYNYTGQVAAGSWDDSAMTLRLSSVLDSVKTNVPDRTLNLNLCGHLPNSNRITI